MASPTICPTDQSDSNELVSHISGIRILGTGIWQPKNVVNNKDLEALGCDSDWIVQRTGILSRHHADESEATSDLAIAAAEDCLKRTGTDIDEIDLILVATMTPDHYTPSTACMVQKGLGATAAAVDMNAACSGFMYALITGSQFIKSGCSRKTLVIGADMMTMVVDPSDKKTFPLFGDGRVPQLSNVIPIRIRTRRRGFFRTAWLRKASWVIRCWYLVAVLECLRRSVRSSREQPF